MAENKNREKLKEILKKEIESVRDKQINLNSKAAVDNLANRILESLVSKFYIIPYMSQESFE